MTDGNRWDAEEPAVDAAVAAALRSLPVRPPSQDFWSDLERRLADTPQRAPRPDPGPVAPAPADQPPTDDGLAPVLAIRPPRSRWKPIGLSVAAAGLIVGGFLAVQPADETVVTRGPAAGGATTVAPAPSAGFTADTPQVSLAASALQIDVGGKRFSGTVPLQVSGDPGTLNQYTTLEVTWREHDVEMRLNIYFTSNGREWWSNEIRTYDGRQQGEWITHVGEFFRSPLGAPFVGDLDITGRRDDGTVGRVRLSGLRLEAFRRPTP